MSASAKTLAAPEVDFETAIHDLKNMASIAAKLTADAIGSSHENVTGHRDWYHLTERQRERVVFAVFNTEERVNVLIAAHRRGGLSI